MRCNILLFVLAFVSLSSTFLIGQLVMPIGEYCWDHHFGSECYNFLKQSKFEVVGKSCGPSSFGSGQYIIENDSIHFYYNKPPAYSELFEISNFVSAPDSVTLNVIVKSNTSPRVIIDDFLIERIIEFEMEYDSIVNGSTFKIRNQTEYFSIIKTGYVPLNFVIDDPGEYDLEIKLIEGAYDEIIAVDHSYRILTATKDSIAFGLTLSDEMLRELELKEDEESELIYVLKKH